MSCNADVDAVHRDTVDVALSQVTLTSVIAWLRDLVMTVIRCASGVPAVQLVGQPHVLLQLCPSQASCSVQADQADIV